MGVVKDERKQVCVCMWVEENEEWWRGEECVGYVGPVWFERREGKGRENEPLPLHGLKNWRGGSPKYSLPFPSLP